MSEEPRILSDEPRARGAAVVGLTTVGKDEDAARLARDLVGERLAACVTRVPAARSIYRWKGEVQEEEECLLLIKTTRERWPALEAWLREHHPYEVPEMLRLPVEAGLEAYLAWLDAQVRPAR